MSAFKFINYKEENLTAIIEINRPDVFNALNIESKLEIIQAIKEANKNNNIRSIVLTGAGKAFCSGQDLNDRNIQGKNGQIDLGYTLETEWLPLVNAIRDSKKIIIGAINGVCAGAGVSVAVACDLIIAKSNIKFVSAFSKLGLAPDAGSSYTFVRALGYQKALEFFLMNTPLSSEELHSAGLVNKLAEDPMAVSLTFSQTINKLSPTANEMIKKNLKEAMDSSLAESISREVSSQRFLGNQEDYKEGLAAFLEKREPSFKGL